MKTKMACLAALLLGVAFAFGAPSKKDKQENLLVNGSFEEGPETEAFLSLDEGATDIKGWTVTRGQIDYCGTIWQHADGKRSIDLHGSPGYGGIKQTFKTKKGQKYKVTFSLAANTEGAVPEKKMAVEAAGKKQEFTADATGHSLADMGWTTKTWEFTADGTETTIELYTLMTEDPNCGPAIDNVSVVAVEK